MAPRAFMVDVEKRKILLLPGLELLSLGCPTRSQSLYWLSYPGKQVAALLYAGFLLVLFLKTEEESGMFFRNVGWLHYTMLYPQDKTPRHLKDSATLSTWFLV
jgi:hypothetical protein